MPKVDREYLTALLADLHRQKQEALETMHRALGAILLTEDLLRRMAEEEAAAAPPPLKAVEE